MNTKHYALSWLSEETELTKRCYDMRQRTRCTWNVIGDKMNISREWARKLAHRHATNKNLPWPVPMLTKGFLYYQSKLDGSSWIQIAYDFNQPCRTVWCTAYRWATRNDMPWPP